MKKTLILILLTAIHVSCCTNKDIITYKFTNDEKMIIPYENQEIIKWKNNDGVVFSGTVLYKNDEVNEFSEYECKRFEGEEINTLLSINNEYYGIYLMKKSENSIDLNITQNIDNIPRRGFNVDVSYFDFNTIEFNNEIFNDALKLEAYGIGNVYLGTLIYSKTNGIEFILFEDGSWYKRLDE